MKAGINTWSFPPSMPLDERFRLAREAGFAGFEIDLTEDGPVNFRSTATELREIRRRAESHGLQLCGLATLLYWETSPTSSDRDVAARASALLDRQLKVAAELGIDAILVVPGAVGVDFLPGAEVVPYGAAYARARAFVAAAVPAAERLGVTIGIENVWNKFLLSPMEMAGFIDSFQSARVASYLDVANVLATGYPEHWIALLGARIVRVHLKDYRRKVGTAEGFVELLSGDVNWPGVMHALRAVGYSGWCTAEMIPPLPFYRHSPEVLIHNTGRAMQAIFGLE